MPVYIAMLRGINVSGHKLIKMERLRTSLAAAGQMMAAGLQAVEIVKADGRWQAAYASARNATPPEDFLQALAKDKKAKAFFETLNRANVYAIVYRLQTAKKPETRERRMKNILAMLARGEKFH